MKTDKTFNEQAALQLIDETIRNTRQKFKDDGFSLIMWGWIVIVGNIINYIALTMHLNYLFAYWAIACTLGGIISGIRGSKQYKKEPVSSFSFNAMKYIWMGCGIGAIILWFAAVNFGWQYINSAMFVAFATPVFITGGIMKFRPAIYGGLILFVFGVGLFFLANYDWANLVAALGWILGYLVPGYLLKRDYKSNV